MAHFSARLRLRSTLQHTMGSTAMSALLLPSKALSRAIVLWMLKVVMPRPKGGAGKDHSSNPRVSISQEPSAFPSIPRANER